MKLVRNSEDAPSRASKLKWKLLIVDDDDFELDALNRLRPNLAQQLQDGRLFVESGHDHADAKHETPNR